MAQIFGIIAGVSGLAGLFTSCVECLQYIRFGRNFGKEYEACQVKLDVVALRLSRWGMAVGLGKNPHLIAPQRQPQVTATPNELKVATKVLSRLLDSLKEAKGASERFETDAEGRKTGGTELVAHFRNVHVTATDIIARRRETGANVWQKTKWAFYSKTKFDGLVEDVTGYIDTLENLFPAAKEVLGEISHQEISELSNDKSLQLLSVIAGKDDEMLVKAVGEVFATKGDNWKNIEIAGEKAASIHVGHDYAAGEVHGKSGSTFDTFKIGGSGLTHVGHRYGRVGDAADN
jgi:hypothetical protein